MNAGEIGVILRAVVTNGGSAMDVSSYTNRMLVFTSQDTGVATSFSAASTTDYTDGAVQYTTAATTDFPNGGVWSVHFTADRTSPTQSIETTKNYFKVG